jgi:hypothetical protein
MPLDERAVIVEDMLSIYLHTVPEKMLKGYLRHLPAKEIPTDLLRRAVTRCIEHGQQSRKPSIFDIHRAAAELRGQQRQQEEDPTPLRPECKKVVHRTPHGKLLCCREEGHHGDCEVWFDHGGPHPDDAETITRLLQPRDRKRKARGFVGLFEEEEIPF